METKVNLDAYFNRISYNGPQTSTPKVLNALHRLHPQAIPFENLNPLLRIPVRLEPESLQQKLIDDGRGGYCFEHNLLFRHVLEALGFSVKGLAARILWNVPEGRITPRGHMLLLVEADGKSYIADVGFGGLTLTAPLLLEADLVQETPHESYRLLQPKSGTYILQARVRDEWKPLYSFDLQQQFLPDYEVTNWYLSNHPESHFVTGLIAARSEPGIRYALRNNELSVHHLNGKTEKHELETVTELKEMLEEIFLITLPDIAELDITLEQLISPKKQSA